MSGIDRYDTALFSVHMAQHVLLTLVAAPLIALSAPITTLLRAATPNVRRRLILPILHSRVMRVLSFPVVAWLVFAGVMWGSHFSPLFNAALEDPLIHDLEHALYLVAGFLFWWPAVALDPSPWRMPHPVRAMYVFLQMPQNTFLAVTILNSGVPLYPHYETLARSWGPGVLEDQRIAGGLMWITGDVLFLTAMAAILAGWMLHEKRQEATLDRRLAAERAAIRERETRLAQRLASERDPR
jgi:putative copper resistance protein D